MGPFGFQYWPLTEALDSYAFHRGGGSPRDFYRQSEGNGESRLRRRFFGAPGRFVSFGRNPELVPQLVGRWRHC